jgi:hypothetical protein
VLIYTKIKDRNATLVTMNDGTRYAFVPNDDGDYVAEVEDKAHIERFLSIPEGYGVYSADVIPASVAKEALEAAKTAQDEADALAAEEAQKAAEGKNEPDEDDQEDAPGIPLEAMTLHDLQALYEAELGRKPHHRAGMDKLIEDITAHRASAE